MNEYHTYVITHLPTKTFYIGSTSNLEKRIDAHGRAIRNKDHWNVNIRDLWKIDDEYTITSISASSLKIAQKLEEDMITEFRGSPQLMNIGLQALGGNNISRHPNLKAIKEKWSKSSSIAFERMGAEKRAEYWSRPGELNPMFGKTHSDEIKKFLSENNKGRQTWLGRKHKASSLAILSQKASLRTGEKNSFYGKKHSPQLIKQMSEQNKGRVPTNAIPVIVNGVTYSSAREAGRALGISSLTIRHRVMSKNKKFVNYAFAA